MKSRLLKIALLIVTVFMANAFTGCASSEKNLNTPEGLFAQAKEYESSERFEIAIAKYYDVKNKFPYSPLALEAELAVADVQFIRENYAEAQVAYQNFRDLHPKHAKIDYVIYKSGMSYYKQLPDTVDRDLSLGTDAIYHFDEVIKSFPQSEFTADAKIKRDDVRNRLGEKELYIADFYLKVKKYAPALKRYEQCIAKYAGIGLDPRAHYGALKAAVALSDADKKNFHFKELQTKYAQSTEAKKAVDDGLNR